MTDEEKTALEAYETLPPDDFPVHLYDHVDMKNLLVQRKRGAMKWLDEKEKEIKSTHRESR